MQKSLRPFRAEGFLYYWHCFWYSDGDIPTARLKVLLK